MNLAAISALFFTVVLLVTTAYFLMGGLPLLVLAHDTPLDARFVKSFFNWYYRAAIAASIGACISYALWGRAGIAAGAALIALVTLLLRKRLIPAMEQAGAQIQHSDVASVKQFRKLHSTALLINLVQLIIVLWSVTKI